MAFAQQRCIYLATIRILSFSKFLSSVTISSWESLNVAETSPISVASTSGFSDMSDMKELRSRGRTGAFQFPIYEDLIQFGVTLENVKNELTYRCIAGFQLVFKLSHQLMNHLASLLFANGLRAILFSASCSLLGLGLGAHLELVVQHGQQKGIQGQHLCGKIK